MKFVLWLLWFYSLKFDKAIPAPAIRVAVVKTTLALSLGITMPFLLRAAVPMQVCLPSLLNRPCCCRHSHSRLEVSQS